MCFDKFGLLSKKLAADKWKQEITCLTILSHFHVLQRPHREGISNSPWEGKYLTRVKFKSNYHENRLCIKTLTNQSGIMSKWHHQPAIRCSIKNKKEILYSTSYFSELPRLKSLLTAVIAHSHLPGRKLLLPFLCLVFSVGTRPVNVCMHAPCECVCVQARVCARVHAGKCGTQVRVYFSMRERISACVCVRDFDRCVCVCVCPVPFLWAVSLSTSCPRCSPGSCSQ